MTEPASAGRAPRPRRRAAKSKPAATAPRPQPSPEPPPKTDSAASDWTRAAADYLSPAQRET